MVDHYTTVLGLLMTPPHTSWLVPDSKLTIDRGIRMCNGKILEGNSTADAAGGAVGVMMIDHQVKCCSNNNTVR